MEFFVVDCFAQEKYQGNQLAVFVAPAHLAGAEMQKIAREMNFSEVAFILSDKQENGGYDVRIFTPFVEVPFAGHPVLGTAYMLDKLFQNGDATIKLNLPCGQIAVVREGETYFMLQNQPVFGKIIPKQAIATALSIDQDWISTLPIQAVSTGLEAVIVPVKSLAALESCCVNHGALVALHKNYLKCNILAFTKADNEIRARVFMDDPGYLEDAATGSANGNLAAYLLYYNYFSGNDIAYKVWQGVEMGRPSCLIIRAALACNGVYTIQVGGQVQPVAKGQWD